MINWNSVIDRIIEQYIQKKERIGAFCEALIETLFQSLDYGLTLQPLREFHKLYKEKGYWSDKDLYNTRADNF